MVWRADEDVRCTVYGLRSSRDGRVRYVGQTRGAISKRLRKHLENARIGVKTHCYNWLRAEVQAGHQITATVIESDAKYHEAEKQWIEWYKNNGSTLVNCTDGGEGTLGWKHTQASKEKMLAKRIGRKPALSESRINALRERAREMGTNPVMRAKQAAAISGRKLAKETISKRTATRRANGNYGFSLERKTKHSARMRTWWEQRKGASHVAS